MRTKIERDLGLLLVILSLLTSAVFAQATTTGRLTGTVTDSQGAVIAKAQVSVKNNQTRIEFEVETNDRGEWSIPSIPNGTYTISIIAQGFKSILIQSVKVDVGTITTANAGLEVGGVTEQVVVLRGGSILQSESATVSTTIVGRQIGELPWTTRDAIQLVLMSPGVQTPGTPRTTSVNGLPKSALNITLDGANIQDNFLKSSDGFFTNIQARTDAIEEVTVSTATPSAGDSGEGAVQIKFVTKSGSNNFHGGVFWQHRNTALNSNYYFNNIVGLPRDSLILNQAGGHIGGPIKIPKLFEGRDKALFFINYEEFHLPQTYGAARTILTNTARQGIYTYQDASGTVRQVNLYQIAAAGGFPNTPDPTIFSALGLIEEAAQRGILQSRIGTSNDFNRLDLNFQDPGRNLRRFPTARLDFNFTKDHHLEFIHHYQHYFSLPDGVNGVLAAYPGTGSVLGDSNERGSIYRNTFSFVIAERWALTNRLVNEIRATSSGNGTFMFRREFNAGNFAFWNGLAVNNPFSSAFFTLSNQSRRNTPVKTLNDNLNWQQGTHALNLGFAFTRISAFNQTMGRQTVPFVSLGVVADDPIFSSGTNVFTTTNFPGSTPAQRSEAANLYALLTGRVTGTSKFATFDERSRDYQFVPFTERNHQTEWGLYAQDSWKVRPNLTLNYGLRWEFKPSPINDNLVYTRPGIEGLYGVSGLGNLFKPGVFEGAHTEYRLLEREEKAYKNRYKDFAPNIGFAWTPDSANSFLEHFLGDAGQTVLRGGYSIAYVREGFAAFNSMFGLNEGPVISLSITPSNNPPGFGPPGSVLLRNQEKLPFPSLPSAVFPFTARQGASLNDFNPDIKSGYVQSYSFGLQREITNDMAVEIRYVGNHATHFWRQYELNEVNVFENGFLEEFKIAQNNLAISRVAGRGENYGNQGLPGQGNIPIIQSAIGSTTDLTTRTSLLRGEVGRLAASISGSEARMNRLISSGLVPFISLPDPNNQSTAIALSNYFIVNPRSPGTAFLMDNGTGGTYNSLQLELRRRLSDGLLVQGNYVFAKSLSNTFANDSQVFSQPTTLRNLEYDKGPAPRDIRHAFKLNWIHELPIGPGRRFLNGRLPVVSKLLEGWQWGGVTRIQSGTPILLRSGRMTFNNRESGVLLHNITTEQLQSLVKIRKQTVCDPSGKCQGVVFWLPQSLIDNTRAAFEVGGKTLADLRPNEPYIGPPTEPGKLGSRVFLYGPWQARFDLSLMKRTRIKDTTAFEFRVQFLNLFNRPNFTITDPDTDLGIDGIGPSFGQTRSAYRDFTVSGTNDPGGRLIDFQLRLNF